MLRACGRGRLRALVIAFALGPLAPLASEGEVQAPPTPDELAAIEQLGWRIARHQEAREMALVRLSAMKNYSSIHEGEVVVEGDPTWRVLFLKDPPPNDERRRPLVMLQVEYYPEASEAGHPNMMVPPREADPTSVSHYRAGQIALAKAIESAPDPQPLERVVFRVERGRFMVYLTSRAAPDGHVRFGGDHLVRLASTGRRVESMEALHAGPSVDVSLEPREEGEPTLHAHAERDRPTATDVAIVMRHPEIAPHLVLTPHYMFRIDAKGRISYLGESPLLPAGPGGGEP